MTSIRQTAGAFALGVASTAAVIFVLGADKPTSQPVAVSPRYQISSWAHGRDSGDNYGAYRVDTHTGAVVEIVGQRYTQLVLP